MTMVNEQLHRILPVPKDAMSTATTTSALIKLLKSKKCNK